MTASQRPTVIAGHRRVPPFCKEQGVSRALTCATQGLAHAAPKVQKHVLTAYNRDNQMLLRRKKVCMRPSISPRNACSAYVCTIGHRPV